MAWKPVSIVSVQTDKYSELRPPLFVLLCSAVCLWLALGVELVYESGLCEHEGLRGPAMAREQHIEGFWKTWIACLSNASCGTAKDS